MAAVAFPQDSKTLKLSSGTTYSYVHIPARPGLPTILFLHGFPSSCYDWRFQIAHFRARGYGVLAPDLLGYGETDRPSDAHAYRGKKMASEIVEILDHEGLEAVHGVAHDWGCFLLSRLAIYYPKRLKSASFLVVASKPLGEVIDLDKLNAMSKKAYGYEVLGYWRFFEREEAGEIVNKNVSLFVLSYFVLAMKKIGQACP
jgi:soluble epoxide hydrolase / lipid-phosphate phosphatase